MTATESKIIIALQRQGVSTSFRCFSCPHFTIEAQQWQSTDSYIFRVSYPNDHEKLGRKAGQVAWDSCRQPGEDPKNFRLVSLDGGKRQTVEAIERIFGMTVEFTPYVEAYMYANADTLRIWPHVAGDKYVTLAVYEVGTNTIRHARSNYCLIALDGFMGEPGPCFNVDGAAMRYRAICEAAYAEYLKSHNQRCSDTDNKGWLAWLIGEQIKDAFPEERPVVLDSVVREKRGNY